MVQVKDLRIAMGSIDSYFAYWYKTLGSIHSFIMCITSRSIRSTKVLLGRRYAAPIISTLGTIGHATLVTSSAVP